VGSVARSSAGSKDPSRLIQEVEAIVASGLGAFLVVCLLSYVPESPDVNHGGLLGFTIADILTQGFGFAAYVFPFALVAAGASLFLSARVRLTPVRWVGAAFLILLVSVTLGVYRPHVAPEAAGGWVGGFLATLMMQGLGSGGSMVVLVSLFLLDFMMITGHALSELLHRLARSIDEAFEAARRAVSDFVRSLLQSLRRVLPSAARWNPFARIHMPAFLRRRPETATAVEPRILRRASAGAAEDEDDQAPAPAARRSSPIIEVLRPRSREKSRRSEASQAEFSFGGADGNFRLPAPILLGKHDDRSDYIDEKALKDSSAILEQKLATFGVGGRVTAVRPGPVITTYEFEPEAGVKVSRVVGLCDDLTMALRAHGVRIVAPIPGKNCVGIEVSNKHRAVVGLRDLIDAGEFREHRSPLVLALGRDTTGLAVYADLARMPHLLMAGATGTGKSVALNTYIVSILYKATPNDVRFIMIDPKMLELSLYEGIPHLLVPVVTDVKKAAAALANVMREMDRRFELMKDKKVRSLDDYNRRMAEEKAAADAEAATAQPKARVAAVDEETGEDEAGEIEAAPGPPPLKHEHLPRILVIIDELADLMMTAGREVESYVTRLAQKARAAGIHLIVATQRPSVDVITGLIKANFPSRISFQVTSRPDSRTILDTVGADRLLGNGDALYMAPGTSSLQRLHGGLISDNEIKDIVEYLRGQGEPDYRMEILEGGGGDGNSLEDEEDAYDELYDRAVALVTQHGQGSTSWLQRKLGIGYNRSARIMEMMERDGVVGPADGAKPRKVLVSAL